MKKLLFMLAAVGMLFTACDKNDPEHIYDDHSADLVGTWSCLTENYAEVLIINADGSAVSYGVEDGEYWENVRGAVTVKENNITMIFEDDDNFTGHFDIIPGQAFSLFEDTGERYVYNYCANDLADEIVGMWVCNDSKVEAQNDMMIQTFDANGKTALTGFLPMGDNPEYVLNDVTDYKIVGDLMFLAIPANFVGGDKPKYIAERLIYTPKATVVGDVMTFTNYSSDENKLVSESWLRIKQSLDLAGNKYDYIKTFVTNVKGEDKDIPFLNTSFNFAKMDGSIIDKFLKSTLFAVEFPNANEIKYSFLLDGEINPMTAPIEVEDNKMTIKMSANGPYQDVEVYTFQDQDNTQMHLYMPTSSFEKFFANTSVYVMLGNGQLDKNDADAIAGVYKTIADAVESINLSLVMSKAK